MTGVSTPGGLKPADKFVVMHPRKATPEGPMAAPEPIVKGQTGGCAQLLKVSAPLQTSWNNPTTPQPMKLPAHRNESPHISGPLTFCNGPHSVRGVGFSVNKFNFYLSLCVSLNFFCNDTLRA